MKTKLLFLFGLFAVTFMALSQHTNLPIAIEPAPGEIRAHALILTLIPLLVPIVVAIGKSLLPKVPTWVLPILAPALGALIDYIGSLATGADASPIVAAIYGSAGVGARELYDQIRKRLMDGPKPTTP